METVSIDYFDIREFGTNCGPFGADPPPPSGFARLYHGTSAAAAERILTDGFLPFDSERLLQATATELDITRAQLDELLAATFLGMRKEYVDGKPDDGAYFTDSPLMAADWAWWGSESEAEAEAAKNAHRNPDRWESAYTAFNWTVTQQSHTPMVIAVDVAWEVAISVNLKPLKSFSSWYPPPFHRVHEVRLPVPSDALEVVSAREIEWVVKTDEVRERFGLRWNEIETAISEERVPPPDDANLADLRWWSSSLQHLILEH